MTASYISYAREAQTPAMWAAEVEIYATDHDITPNEADFARDALQRYLQPRDMRCVSLPPFTFFHLAKDPWENWYDGIRIYAATAFKNDRDLAVLLHDAWEENNAPLTRPYPKFHIRWRWFKDDDILHTGLFWGDLFDSRE